MLGVIDYIKITTTVCNLIYHLFPIAVSIYDGFECFRKAATTTTEIEECLKDFEKQVQESSHSKGFFIGKTEAKIICYIVRYIKAKKIRHHIFKIE